jgi:hypothetical protein
MYFTFLLRKSNVAPNMKVRTRDNTRENHKIKRKIRNCKLEKKRPAGQRDAFQALYEAQGIA